jgi:RNA polymerase sigma-70 factor (ECF subfamily)
MNAPSPTHVDPPDLRALLGAVAARDRAAFTRLYNATSAKLFGLVLRIVRRRDLAEEILQEVFVKIWNRASDYDADRASPIAWMATIARNRALDEVRRAAPLSIEDTPEAVNIESNEPDPLQHLAASEEFKRLLACLQVLDGDRRDMVLMAYYHGASREELSARYNAPVATIKTWLHRSLKSLRECLGK